MGSTRPSMQELIRQRRRAGFVGRSDERAVFRRNLDLAPEDERHRFLFHVHGNAGVGKTFLLREWEQLAREKGALTAYVDESVGSVPEAMAAISRQLGGQGHKFKELERLLAAHRERRHEAEAAAVATLEPEPEGPSVGSMAVARAGLAGLGMVPGVGAFVGALDAAQLAQGADRLRAGLSTRFRSQEDVQLVLSPERVLTPVLLSELSDAAAAAPWIVLFFDTYERTGPFLDGWLHEVMTSDLHGTLPATVVLVTAGQRPFDTARWGAFADFMTDVPLGPFTEAEARGLLAAKGVVSEPVVEEVLRLTGGLPVLVSTLAEARPADPEDVGDPSADAVERFLKWERDPVRRAVALACALPRRMDVDVFRVVVDCPAEQLDELYGWLRGIPFVSERGEGAQYHDVVRAPMLRLQRLRSPRDWTGRHIRLAEAFGRWRAEAEAELAPDELWRDEGWREIRLAELYHLLCARPRSVPPTVLRELVDACGGGEVVVRRWAQALTQAGEDADAERAKGWGSEVLAALDRGGVINVLGVLLAKGRLDARGRAKAHGLRGAEFGSVGDHATALTQFDRAVELDPESAPAYEGRAVARAHLGDYAGAITDLDRADGLAPGKARTLSLRGDYRRVMGDFVLAVRDLDRVVELDPTRETAWASRGVARHMLGDTGAAVSDLDRALELDSGYVWALVRRARVWRSRGDQERRLADLDRAVALGPDAPWVLCERGDALSGAGRQERALADYDRAIALDGEYASAYASRGACRAGMGNPAEALTDLDRALEIDPEYVWAFWQRARVHHALGSRDRASADIQRALEIDPDHWMAQRIRFRIEARRLLNDETWSHLARLRDWLEATLSEPNDPDRVPTALGFPDEMAEELETYLDLPAADRADIAQRLTDLINGRDDFLDAFN
ncbi:tetratricopeptide repeat protein [Streptomyces sp. V4I2]|uniref:tetratricopeptide repeat protein n=1 Tax=Streptomyces sp. V4I2 TaxID=3042280 RepID=UPI00278B311E|nr:tetratricopeptide repeat protein [Streptomyces sp. V4I2]MDQ1046412.1 tetratricopeptide (TPR) repeat protein [Streptomyces sp. V4I2]